MRNTRESMTVYLIYYRYDSEESMRHRKWFLNLLTSKITGSQYIHVEIVFSEDKMAYTVVPGRPIYKAPKVYTRDTYVCERINATPEQEAKMRRFLEDRMERPSGFNYWGFYCMPLCPCSGEKSNKWFCSELAAAMLLHAGYTLPNEPCALSPGALYMHISENPEIGRTDTMLDAEKRIFHV